MARLKRRRTRSLPRMAIESKSGVELGEPLNALKLGSVALIVVGVIGLNAAGGH